MMTEMKARVFKVISECESEAVIYLFPHENFVDLTMRSDRGGYSSNFFHRFDCGNEDYQSFLSGLDFERDIKPKLADFISEVDEEKLLEITPKLIEKAFEAGRINDFERKRALDELVFEVADETEIDELYEYELAQEALTGDEMSKELEACVSCAEFIFNHPLFKRIFIHQGRDLVPEKIDPEALKAWESFWAQLKQTLAAELHALPV